MIHKATEHGSVPRKLYWCKQPVGLTYLWTYQSLFYNDNSRCSLKIGLDHGERMETVRPLRLHCFNSRELGRRDLEENGLWHAQKSKWQDYITNLMEKMSSCFFNAQWTDSSSKEKTKLDILYLWLRIMWTSGGSHLLITSQDTMLGVLYRLLWRILKNIVLFAVFQTEFK